MTGRNTLKATRESTVLFILFGICGILLCQIIAYDAFRLPGAEFLMLESVVIWFILISAYFYLGYRLIDPIVLWFLFLTLFMMSRVFLDVLGVEDLGQIRNFIRYSVSTEVEWRATLNLIIAMISFSIGWLLFARRQTRLPDNNPAERIISSEAALTRIGLILLVLCVPAVFMYFASVALFVAEQGYLSYHLGQGPTKSIVIFALEQLSWLALALFLAGVPTRKTFIAVLLLIVIPLLVGRMLSGARGFSMVMIVTLFWYWHYIYNKNVRILVWLPLSGLLVFGLLYIGAYRGGSYLEYDDLLQLGLYFLDGQGTSVTTLLASVEHIAEKPLADFGFSNIFAELFMQFDKLEYRITDSVQPSLESVAFDHGYSGYLVSHALRNDLLATGASLGTSYVTELFLVGREGAQFIGGVIFGYAFHKFFRAIHSHRLVFLGFLILLPQLLYLPRMSIFSIVSANFLPLTALLTLWIVWLYAGRAKQRHTIS